MKTEEQSIWEELELAFGGGSKFRVILHLILNPKEAFTKYALVKATGLRTPSVESQLKTLLELNWVQEYSLTPKTYQIDLENVVVNRVLEFFRKIRYVSRPMP
jgi:DNA-binding IclR family transcriptional regulator